MQISTIKKGFQRVHLKQIKNSRFSEKKGYFTQSVALPVLLS